MKKCSTCKEVKPYSDFYRHNSTKDGYDSNCKQCKSINNKKIVEKRNQIKNQLKIEAGGRCVKCGYNKCMAALDFHHKDPTIKEADITEILLKGLNENIIEEAKIEIMKCELLCANCHREEHYKLNN